MVAAVAAIAAVALFVGLRYGLLLAVGMGFGLVLEGMRFGFAGPWRAMIVDRNPSGILAQLLAIALVAIVAIPILELRGDELTSAAAPIGYAMVGAAFCFGVAMQIILSCGSGTLVNAGSGNLIALIALPLFAIGSFAGSQHLHWWTGLGALPVYEWGGFSGLVLTLAGLAAVAMLVLYVSPKRHRQIPRRYLVAACLLAGLAILNIVIAGQPWGVVYGLGLWVAKGAVVTGVDLSTSTFWSVPSSVERLQESLFTDYTSLTNIGILVGAFAVVCWRQGGLSQTLPRLTWQAWAVAAITGFVLGYTARLAFGCNVGAFFSGISTGSAHGWVWFGAAFLGACIGVRIRPAVGLAVKS